jgi:putative ABC transport system ATP-binding protein
MRQQMRISLQNVTHEYAATDEAAAVRVLSDISLEIASGAFAVLMGASGSGKSTLLNLIGAVDRPTSGHVVIGETDTTSVNESVLTNLRRTSIGFVFQFFNLIPTLNVFENIAFPLSLNKGSRNNITPRVREVLREIDLEKRERHYPNELSGGEMQRVAIGRAIVHRPPLIIADEPTGNLDSANGNAVLELMRGIHRDYKPTVVMATHSDHAASFGDYIIRIADGRIAL